ncbi:MAG: flavodoxin, partial [Clostridiales bacterium]|nr:flavodoxin [Clostridiales bacterium]
QSTPNTSASVLVAYISNTGNTEAVAERIAELTDGDLAEIQRARPYGDLQSEAQAEINNGTQPAITVEVDDISEYEVIFIGYPIWWDEAPAMIATFLAENDFDGKIIAPFCTSAYSSIDNSLHIFDELAPEAELADGLTANHLSAVPDWVSEVMAAA